MVKISLLRGKKNILQSIPEVVALSHISLFGYSNCQPMTVHLDQQAILQQSVSVYRLFKYGLRKFKTLKSISFIEEMHMACCLNNVMCNLT